jgi:hypothetical protein
MSEFESYVPRIWDIVSVQGYPKATFEVAEVQRSRRSADLDMVDRKYHKPDVLWTALTLIKKTTREA